MASSEMIFLHLHPGLGFFYAVFFLGKMIIDLVQNLVRLAAGLELYRLLLCDQFLKLQ